MNFDDIVNAAALKASGMVMGGLNLGGADLDSTIYKKLIQDAKAIDRQIPPSKEDLLEIKKALLASADGFKPAELKQQAQYVTKHMTELFKLFNAVQSATGKSKEALGEILDTELGKLSNNDIYFYMYSIIPNDSTLQALFTRKLLAMQIDFKKIEKEIKDERKNIEVPDEKKGNGRGRKKKQP